MPELATADIAYSGSTSSVVSLVAALIEAACAEGASDIHLDPAPDGMRVRVRIDGVLGERHTLPSHVHAETIARIKILSGLRTDEHQAPQDGRFRFARRSGAPADIRVSIMPTHYGENAVLRILADRAEGSSLEALGFLENDRTRIARALQKPGGMILATGPTGSGKTTTLYALIELLRKPGVSIVTIEDPIEYGIEGVRQIQVNPRTGLTFAAGLRGLLRQDPDLLMVGEIRDTETARIAVHTALTGHLVLSTLHTTNAATAIPRMLDMGIEPYLAASTIELVIAQRLVRRICESCREETRLPAAAIARLPGALKERAQGPWYRGTGCAACTKSGYRGRIVIGETLALDAALREAIHERRPASVLAARGVECGMQPMLEDGVEKARRGFTTLEEVMRVTHE